MNDKYIFTDYTGEQIDNLLQWLQTYKNNMLDTNKIIGNYTYILPSQSGTLALTSDLADKADKHGPLPKYAINNSSIDMVQFISDRSLSNKPFIFSIDNTNYLSFVQCYNSWITHFNICTFYLKRLDTNDIYTGTISLPTNVTFQVPISTMLGSSYHKIIETQSNKVTSVSSSSTNTEYPSAKAVWDIKGTKLYKHEFRIEANLVKIISTISTQITSISSFKEVYDNMVNGIPFLTIYFNGPNDSPVSADVTLFSKDANSFLKGNTINLSAIASDFDTVTAL